MDALIGFADAMQRVFPTTMSTKSRYLECGGWIRQEAWCDRSSVTFDVRQCALVIGKIGLSGSTVAVQKATASSSMLSTLLSPMRRPIWALSGPDNYGR